jgi:hypothetical protein
MLRASPRLYYPFATSMNIDRRRLFTRYDDAR